MSYSAILSSKSVWKGELRTLKPVNEIHNKDCFDYCFSCGTTVFHLHSPRLGDRMSFLIETWVDLWMRSSNLMSTGPDGAPLSQNLYLVSELSEQGHSINLNIQCFLKWNLTPHWWESTGRKGVLTYHWWKTVTVHNVMSVTESLGDQVRSNYS